MGPAHAPDDVGRPPIREPSSSRRRAIGVLAVIGAAIVAALAAAGDRAPTTGGATSGVRLAIVDAGGQLSVTDRDGAVLLRFPADAPAVRFPAFSPDGSRIAAIGGDGETSGVFVYRLTATRDTAVNPVAVFERDATGLIYLAWSPDGDRIGVLTAELDTLAVHLVAPDRSAPDATVHRGQPLYWDWWGGRGLFVHAGGTGPRAVLDEIGPDGVAADLGLGPSGLFQAPAISRDGTWRAYAAIEAAGRQVLRIEERAGPGTTDVAIGAAVAFGWDPVGDRLAFVDGGGAAGTGLGPLRLIQPGDPAPRTVLDRPVAAWFWSPDGRSVAAFTLQLRTDDSVASALRQVRPPVDLHLVIVDVEAGGIRSDRVIRPGDLFLRQFVPFYDQYAKSHRLWAPDSSALVLPLVDDDGVERITVIPVDDGPVVAIAPGVLAFWSP